MTELSQHLTEVQRKIAEAAKERSITLIAVSKTKPVADIEAVHAQGVHDFGENYLQEALPKIQSLQNLNIRWHYLGRLQSKKLKEIVAHFATIHSLDRLDHAKKLDCIAKEMNKIQEVFVQVNLDEEPQKGGVSPKELKAFISELKHFKHLRVLGLMLIPKPADSATTLQKFGQLKALSHSLNEGTLHQLSMGMSHDYELAIHAGATHVRVGSAIFGERVKKQQ